MNSTTPYLIIFDDFGYFIPNFYSYISPLKDKIEIDLENFEYSKLVLSFYYNDKEYILKHKEQFIHFDLFKNISDNTHYFDIFYLVNNPYIIEQYSLLNENDKNKLITNNDMYTLFKEIDIVLNFKQF